MPTYDYRCKKCDHVWELFHSIKAAPVKKCPKCGKLAAERVIGAGGGVIFRGSGFYQTDYRSEGYKKAAAADKKAGESSLSGGGESKGDSSSGKSEKKPAAKEAT
jgi:putative FmdB family regulatory protein